MILQDAKSARKKDVVAQIQQLFPPVYAELQGLADGCHFISFIYPGSIPGHTMSMNSFGLAYTVNNIRLTEKKNAIPRMITSRTLLESSSVDDFISLLSQHDVREDFITPLPIESHEHRSVSKLLFTEYPL